jgi:hypothetical protein
VSGSPDAVTDQMLPLLAGIGMKRARLLLVDEYCDIDAQGNFGTNSGGTFTPGDCFPLAWQIDWLIKANLSPHMAVASHMPTSFVQYGPAESWGEPAAGSEQSEQPENHRSLQRLRQSARALHRDQGVRCRHANGDLRGQ